MTDDYVRDLVDREQARLARIEHNIYALRDSGLVNADEAAERIACQRRLTDHRIKYMREAAEETSTTEPLQEEQ